jgi:WD40 repeat protein
MKIKSLALSAGMALWLIPACGGSKKKGAGGSAQTNRSNGPAERGQMGAKAAKGRTPQSRPAPRNPVPSAVLKLDAPKASIDQLLISPRGRLLATLNGYKLRIWRLPKLVLVRETRIKDGKVIRFSPDGRWLMVSDPTGAYGSERAYFIPVDGRQRVRGIYYKQWMAGPDRLVVMTNRDAPSFVKGRPDVGLIDLGDKPQKDSNGNLRYPVPVVFKPPLNSDGKPGFWWRLTSNADGKRAAVRQRQDRLVLYALMRAPGPKPAPAASMSTRPVGEKPPPRDRPTAKPTTAAGSRPAEKKQPAPAIALSASRLGMVELRKQEVYELSADGSRLVCRGRKGIRIFDTEGGKPLGSPTLDYRYGAPYALGPKGRVMAFSTRSSGVVTVVSLPHGKTLLKLKSQKDTRLLAFTPDGKQLLTGHSDTGRVSFWRLADGKQLRSFVPHPPPVQGVAIPPDGRTVAVVQDDKLRFHSTANGESRPSGLAGSGPKDVAFLPDGKTIATLLSGTVVLNPWPGGGGAKGVRFVAPVHLYGACADQKKHAETCDPSEDPRLECTREVPPTSLRAFAFSATGKHLVTGLWASSKWRCLPGHTLAIWDVDKGRARPRFRKQYGTVRRVAISPQGRFVLEIDRAAHARFWDVEAHKRVRSLRPVRASAIAFSPDGKLAAVGSQRYRIVQLHSVPDVKRGRKIKVSGARTIAFHPNGKVLAAAGARSGRIDLYDVQTGKRQRTLRGHHHSVTRLAWNRPGTVLVSGGRDGRVVIWPLTK